MIGKNSTNTLSKVPKRRGILWVVLMTIVFFPRIIMVFFAYLARLAAPKSTTSVTIDGVKYRSGFYGDLYPVNLRYKSDYFRKGSKMFRRVDCEQFDWVQNSKQLVFCAKSQWKRAQAYYADRDIFAYYCRIGVENIFSDDPEIIAIPGMDSQKFDALMAFAEKNRYDPFGSNKNVKTRRLSMPDSGESQVIVFYRESSDGFFSSSRRYRFHILYDKLFLLFYYEHGGGAEKKCLVAVDVPDELGKYFIELLTELDIKKP